MEMSNEKFSGSNQPLQLVGSNRIPLTEDFLPISEELVALTDECCNEILNEEYREVCRELAACVCQPGAPVKRGKRKSWACGIVYSVGWVNFLSDPNNEPHMRSEEIADWFGVSTATMHSKSKLIREGLGLIRHDPDFTLPSRQESNPLIQIAPILSLLHPEEADSDDTYAVVQQRLANTKRSEPRQNVQPTQAAYQIKITLEHSDPVIWRRCIVPDCTLDALHEVIQHAMGWENYHMHEFQVGKERYSMPDMEDYGMFDDIMYNENDVLLSELVAEKKKQLRYWYDFGDDWWHTIKIEKKLPLEPDQKHAVCIDGACACPPEDVGGVWGYANFRQALADPKHPDHEHFSEWVCEDFDPSHFDLAEVNDMLASS